MSEKKIRKKTKKRKKKDRFFYLIQGLFILALVLIVLLFV